MKKSDPIKTASNGIYRFYGTWTFQKQYKRPQNQTIKKLLGEKKKIYQTGKHCVIKRNNLPPVKCHLKFVPVVSQ